MVSQGNPYKVCMQGWKSEFARPFSLSEYISLKCPVSSKVEEGISTRAEEDPSLWRMIPLISG